MPEGLRRRLTAVAAAKPKLGSRQLRQLPPGLCPQSIHHNVFSKNAASSSRLTVNTLTTEDSTVLPRTEFCRKALCISSVNSCCACWLSWAPWQNSQTFTTARTSGQIEFLARPSPYTSWRVLCARCCCGTCRILEGIPTDHVSPNSTTSPMKALKQWRKAGSSIQIGTSTFTKLL